jgi:hypothetical protein
MVNVIKWAEAKNAVNVTHGRGIECGQLYQMLKFLLVILHFVALTFCDFDKFLKM